MRAGDVRNLSIWRPKLLFDGSNRGFGVFLLALSTVYCPVYLLWVCLRGSCVGFGLLSEYEYHSVDDLRSCILIAFWFFF